MSCKAEEGGGAKPPSTDDNAADRRIGHAQQSMILQQSPRTDGRRREEIPLSRTVYLHVGVAKTGTTYLQRIMFANREQLKANGVLFPGAKAGAHFLASLDLRESKFAGHTYTRAGGAWAQLSREINAFSGRSVVSHETLARTRRPVIKRAVEGLNTDDIRVVLTVRDLARQIPAVWQENLKNRNKQSYEDFLEMVLDSERRRRLFWMPQNLVGLTSRWSEMVGPERVTLVTVPAPGAEREELWRRFAAALELPKLDYRFPQVGQNSSLGSAEAELLRRLNQVLPEQFDWEMYSRVIKRRLAEHMLAPINAHGRIVVPEKWHARVEEISAHTIDGLSSSGCRVVGSLDDLKPRFEQATGPAPDEIGDSELFALSLEVMRRLMVNPPHGATSIKEAVRLISHRMKARVKRG